jgi:antirestriction protein
MHTQKTDTAPRVFVGTYAKYNAGRLRGFWVDLEDFAGDRPAFLEHCRELHNDEHDPELMFPDYEGFPAEYYGECELAWRLFEWLELDEDDRELLAAYMDATNDRDADICDARDHYVGTYDSGADFAESLADDLGIIQTGMTKTMPDWLVHCIDWQRAWENELRHDYSTSEGVNGRGLVIFHN